MSRLVPLRASKFQYSTDTSADLDSKSQPSQPVTTHTTTTSSQNPRLSEKAEKLLALVVQRFNELSGYNEIERLKLRITECTADVHALRKSLEQAREALVHAQRQQVVSQREVNEMLLRKHEWSASDVQRFTDLYRQDHGLAHEVEQSSIAARAQEEKLEDARTELQRAVGERYREEQIWSDKIRRASTWGTLVLTAVNIVFFLLVQLILEPWKRRRLVNAVSKQFEERLETMQREHIQEEIEAVKEAVSEPEPVSELEQTHFFAQITEQAKQLDWSSWTSFWQSVRPLGNTIGSGLSAAANSVSTSIKRVFKQIDTQHVLLLAAGTLIGVSISYTN